MEGGAVATPSSDAASQDALNGAVVELFATYFQSREGEEVCLLPDCVCV